MPILLESVLWIAGAITQPLGMAKQLTLSESGAHVPKFRLTQDLSFSLTEKKVSVNAGINMDEYAEMIYGWCLPRTIQYIISLRHMHPNTRIFIAKYDYSDAYCRIAHLASAAIQLIALFDKLAFIALGLTFGGSPNPPTCCMFSKTVTDLANELLLCPEWDKTKLYNPDQAETPALIHCYNLPCFASARKTAFKVPLSSTAQVDGFVDEKLLYSWIPQPTGPKPPTPSLLPCMLQVALMPARNTSP
jgi:hypothetical protein